MVNKPFYLQDFRTVSLIPLAPWNVLEATIIPLRGGVGMEMIIISTSVSHTFGSMECFRSHNHSHTRRGGHGKWTSFLTVSLIPLAPWNVLGATIIPLRGGVGMDLHLAGSHLL